MKAEAIIIHTPERQRLAQRALFAAVTFAAWIAWASLWLPLLTLLAWIFGLRTSYVQLAVYEHGQGGKDMIALFALATICSLTMIAWSSYNRMRFARKDRRRQTSLIEWPAIAGRVGVHVHTAAWMQDAPRFVLEFSDEGIVSIRWNMPLPSPAVATEH